MTMDVNRLLLACSLTVALASACHRDRDAEGPMERAGKGVDRAADESGRALRKGAEKTGEAVEHAADATGEALQKAGKKLKGDDTPKTEPKPAP
jgi:hypothetical protein